MILRRLSKHVKDQNWFAVALDFFIVVLGILIAFQITNWSASRQDRLTERAAEARLLSEFQFQKEQLSELKVRLAGFVEAARNVVVAIKDDVPPTDREQFAVWLYEATNLGRPPARSAMYIQLISSGEFDVLRDDRLKALLIRYDQEIERNRFLYETGADLLFGAAKLVEATSSNFDEVKDMPLQFTRFTDFDFERLKDSEGELEWIFYLHSNNYTAADRLEALVDEIIAVLDAKVDSAP
jgi:type II secretory pathway pseudopilin PulG